MRLHVTWYHGGGTNNILKCKVECDPRANNTDVNVTKSDRAFTCLPNMNSIPITFQLHGRQD